MAFFFIKFAIILVNIFTTSPIINIFFMSIPCFFLCSFILSSLKLSFFFLLNFIFSSVSSSSLINSLSYKVFYFLRCFIMGRITMFRISILLRFIISKKCMTIKCWVNLKIVISSYFIFSYSLRIR